MTPHLSQSPQLPQLVQLAHLAQLHVRLFPIFLPVSLPILLPILLLIGPGSALSADAPLPAAPFVNADALVWGPAPASLPKGARIAVLQGDPARDGPYTIRLQAPSGYRVAPHYHSRSEDLTVLRGNVYIGIGDVVEPDHARALHAGGFHHLPARLHHYAYTAGTTEVQISGQGPFDIVYVHVADDPATQGPAAPGSTGR